MYTQLTLSIFCPSSSRYIRLLFTREMPFNSAMRIWDGLFAADGRLDELVQYVCVAMLLRIRHLREPSVCSDLARRGSN